MYVEVEVKKEEKIEGRYECAICDNLAIRRVWIGQIQYPLPPGIDYYICHREQCVDAILDDYASFQMRSDQQWMVNHAEY